MSTHALLVLTTLGSAEDARVFVTGLVEDRLVACGTVLPGAESVYRWEGTITQEQEVVVLLKTDASKWDELRAAVDERHPYEVPELLAFPVERGNDLYLSWLTSEVVA
jgi:periplasmic divalent cation tolerance protein